MGPYPYHTVFAYPVQENHSNRRILIIYTLDGIIPDDPLL